MYAPRRAALLALCAIAVVLAASLFPATGLGTYPSDVWSGAPGGPPMFGSGGDPVQQPATPAQPQPATEETTTAPTTTYAPADNSDPPRDESSSGGGLWPVALLLGFVAVLGLALNRLGYERRGFWLVHATLPDIPPAFVRSALGTVPRVTMGFVVGLSATLPRLLDDTSTVVAAAGSAVGTVARGAARATVVTVTAVPAAFAAGASGLTSGIGSALGALPGAVSSLGGQTSREWPSSDTAANTSAGDDRADAEARGPLTVEEAWAEMTARVPIRNRSAATPGQYAREAVRRGLPSRSVGTLTRAFQEVRYGDRDGTGERLDAARDAYDDIDDEGDDV
ncbi:DUF4129 domain-containing protein [Halomarina salina]|uniref:DUF4129 domain-containing protein n=1 Tax=Halomarina salina TaxID=1872699 RepID=A0ABD5RL51_9EURY